MLLCWIFLPLETPSAPWEVWDQPADREGGQTWQQIYLFLSGQKAKTSRAGSSPGQHPAHLLYLQLSHKLHAIPHIQEAGDAQP